jgi:hypothetical protein
MKGRHDVGIAKLGGGSYMLPIYVKLEVSNVPIVGCVNCEAKLWKREISLRRSDHVRRVLMIIINVGPPIRLMLSL